MNKQIRVFYLKIRSFVANREFVSGTVFHKFVPIVIKGFNDFLLFIFG